MEYSILLIVMIIIGVIQIDPEGIEIRRRKRLRRRQYTSKGPNDCWHLDGYDKLTPYGISIHGCIDGFSRFVIWLAAYRTNRDPKIIGTRFISAVNGCQGCPRKVRADRGTENGHIAFMQRFFRRNHGDSMAGQKSFIYGKSIANQRIEAWWSLLRKESAQYWMNILSLLKDEGHFSGDLFDKNLVQFCFMKLIQVELDDVVKVWNHHRIARSHNMIQPSGKPFLMYNFPSICDGEEQLKPVDPVETDLCQEQCTDLKEYPCNQHLFALCTVEMVENGLEVPSDGVQAAVLYIILRDKIKPLMFI